jgi:hypothetical protein
MPRHPKVYFYCCEEPDNYQDDIIQLAEGLDALGIPYFARCNYWLRSATPGDYLFRATPDQRTEDCDVVVVPYTWFNWIRRGRAPERRHFPHELFRGTRRPKVVYMDTNDGYRTVSWNSDFRQFDTIFRSKYNQRLPHPANMVPWTHCLPNRVLKETAEQPAWERRRREIAFSFGASHGVDHSCRARARKRVAPMLVGVLALNLEQDDLSQPPEDPYERLMWDQTNARHRKVYYERLLSLQACAAFCGEIIPALPFDAHPYTVDGGRARVMRAFYNVLGIALGRDGERIIQWDSWRFWEGLAAGCAAFHVDLERYGVQMPVMPVNRIHYVGVDLNDPRDTVEWLRSDPGALERIAKAGRQWALDYYAPGPTASRFLATLGL